jgi:hypothetical protein
MSDADSEDKIREAAEAYISLFMKMGLSRKEAVKRASAQIDSARRVRIKRRRDGFHVVEGNGAKAKPDQ